MKAVEHYKNFAKMAELNPAYEHIDYIRGYSLGELCAVRVLALSDERLSEKERDEVIALLDVLRDRIHRGERNE